MIIRVKVAKELNKPELKKNISSGLYWLAVGNKPFGEIPMGEPVTVAITLNESGKKFYKELRPAFSSDRDLVRNALMVVSELPSHCRCQL